MSRTIKLLISNWPRTREFSQRLQAGKLLLTFPTMVTRWSRSTSSFYALIGQNLTGEFMRKIYQASWNLFTENSNLRWPTSATAKLTFPRQILLLLGKTYFLRQNLFFHGKTYFRACHQHQLSLKQGTGIGEWETGTLKWRISKTGNLCSTTRNCANVCDRTFSRVKLSLAIMFEILISTVA